MAPIDGTPSPLDLRQVLYFITVASELNFTRAADHLRISPPSLSQQIKVLERHVGVQLLVRDTRHVRLTPAGEIFAQRGRALLEAGENALLEARGTSGPVTGRLQVGCLHEAEVAFEPFLTNFHAAYPGIQVSVTTMRHWQLIDAFRAGTIDAALTWSYLLERGANGRENGLAWLTVANVEVVAAVGARSPRAAEATIRRGESLRGVPTVLFERSYSPLTFDYAVDQLYGPGCLTPPVREVAVTVRAQEAMAREVADSDGLAPLSRPVADMMGGAWEIRPFDPPWFLEACVVWEPGGNSAPLLAFMAQVTAEWIRAGVSH